MHPKLIIGGDPTQEIVDRKYDKAYYVDLFKQFVFIFRYKRYHAQQNKHYHNIFIYYGGGISRVDMNRLIYPLSHKSPLQFKTIVISAKALRLTYKHFYFNTNNLDFQRFFIINTEKTVSRNDTVFFCIIVCLRR